MKTPLVIISTIVLMLIVISGVSYFIGNPFPTKPPPPPSAPATEPPPPPAESEPMPEQPPPSIEPKIEELLKAMADVSATGESKEITLVFTEDEINDQAAILVTQFEMPPDVPAEIKSLHIDLQAENNLVAEMRAAAFGIEIPIKVRASIRVEESKLKVEITSVDFGAVPLPQSVKDSFVAAITQKIDEALVQLTESGAGVDGKVAFEFKDIAVQPETVTITVVIKPRE